MNHNYGLDLSTLPALASQAAAAVVAAVAVAAANSANAPNNAQATLESLATAAIVSSLNQHLHSHLQNQPQQDLHQLLAQLQQLQQLQALHQTQIKAAASPSPSSSPDSVQLHNSLANDNSTQLHHQQQLQLQGQQHPQNQQVQNLNQNQNQQQTQHSSLQLQSHNNSHHNAHQHSQYTQHQILRHSNASIQQQQQLLATTGFNPLALVSCPGQQVEILTPTHLKKAKLMFFYVRYPNSAILKECFRDVRFNKNNTAQLVKWFSNFREFYYIQMVKYAEQAVAEGLTCKEQIAIDADHELLTVLNNHYNKNRHIELPEVFRQVVEETLRHFFDAILTHKNEEQSWKKSIYKLIARLDQEVPEFFKAADFSEQLEQ